MSPACAHDTPILPKVAQKFASSMTDKTRKLALFNSSTHTHTHTATHSHTHIGQKLYAGVYCLLPSASLNYFAIYFNKFNVLRHYFLSPCQPVSGLSPGVGVKVCLCVCVCVYSGDVVLPATPLPKINNAHNALERCQLLCLDLFLINIHPQPTHIQIHTRTHTPTYSRKICLFLMLPI